MQKQPPGATSAQEDRPFPDDRQRNYRLRRFAGAAYASDVEASDRRPSGTKPRVRSRRIRQLHRRYAWCRRGYPSWSGTKSASSTHEEPWSIQTSYYPMSFVERGATKLLAVEASKQGTRPVSEAIGAGEIGLNDTMTVRAPAPGEASRFGFPEDGRVAVFETCQ